jgi:hypothetical protein
MDENLSEDIEYRHFRGLQQGLSNIVCTLEHIVDRITVSIHQLTRKHSENIGHVHHMAPLNSWMLHMICHIHKSRKPREARNMGWIDQSLANEPG